MVSSLLSYQQLHSAAMLVLYFCALFNVPSVCKYCSICSFFLWFNEGYFAVHLINFASVRVIMLALVENLETSDELVHIDVTSYGDDTNT